MCLIVDFDKIIDDAFTYTFHKFYRLDTASLARPANRMPILISPFYYHTPPPSGRLVARDMKGRMLPARGQAAYDKYAYETGLFEYALISEGIHAYRSSAAAINHAYVYPVYAVATVKVRGPHIIAVGTDDDVAFTRGQITEIFVSDRGRFKPDGKRIK